MAVKIEKLSEIDSILQSPDIYFGDIKVANTQGYTYDETTNKVNKDKQLISFVLLKMADELLMNTTDNYIRSKNTNTKMTYIKVNIDGERINIENDGLSIPIIKYKNTEQYVPEITFTSLFSSSNFNNERKGAGKNGVGASITNVMSNEFIIDINDNDLNYHQVIHNNCKNIDKPIISKINDSNKSNSKDNKTNSKNKQNGKQNNNHVAISFIPDMKRIISIGLDKDEMIKDAEKVVYNNTIPFIKRRVLDIAMVMNNCVNVYLNDVNLSNINLQTYANMFMSNSNDNLEFVNFKKMDLYEILIPTNSSEKNKTIITFVNNICVSKGVHITNLIEQIYKYVCKQLKITGDKIDNVKKIISRNISIIMKCNVINPMFEGQGKNNLRKCDNLKDIKLSDKDLKTLYEAIDFDVMVNGNTTDDINKKLKIKKGKKLIIDKLADAELAGTKQSKNCTLFLCEGDSAAKLAKDGIAQLGHDKFGVYPLGGKPLNVRGETIQKITANKTVVNLAKIIGLPIRTKQQIKNSDIDLNSLRYGRIVMLKDADTDGAHIMGLVINLLEQLYPELLNINGFFNEFITPMIKLVIPNNVFNKLDISKNKSNTAGTIIKTSKNTIYPFYNVDDYNKFIKKYPTCDKFAPMYIKGLGGHNDSDTREYFKNYINNVIGLNMDETSTKYLDIAFNKKLADDRKELLEARTGEHALPRYVGKPIDCSDFINNDWLDYSYDACVRAIPSIMDGLKPSQRKVLYVMLNNYKPAKSNTEENSSNFRKVFQICGEVAQKGYYHHGDQSLNATIIGMAQDFTGSNNLPLLAYSGSFGSRDLNGDDAGAPRYISATIHEVARYIFPKEDDQLLVPNVEDNVEVEPKYYIPIIPMIFVNGAIGIGTGYSTMILQHNPLDIINMVVKYMKFRKHDADKFPVLHPKYNYYKGEIKLSPEWDKRYNVYGKYTIKGNKVIVEEVPFQISKQKFIKELQTLYTNGEILNFTENKTKTLNDFSFEITFNPEGPEITDDYVQKKLLLLQTLSINNMNGFNAECKLTEYNNEYQIFREWYENREKAYIKRKELIMNSYEEKIKLISAKAKFIQDILEGKLEVYKKPKQFIVDYLVKNNYPEIDGNYNYLLNIPIISLTKEQYEKLINERDNLINNYENYKSLSINHIWKDELNKLKEYIINNYDVENW